MKEYVEKYIDAGVIESIRVANAVEKAVSDSYDIDSMNEWPLSLERLPQSAWVACFTSMNPEIDDEEMKLIYRWRKIIAL